MMAKGCCAWAVSFRRAAVGLRFDSTLVANRRLPSLSLASAASAGTEAAGGSAARTKAAALKQAMVTKTGIFDVVFIGRSDFVEDGKCCQKHRGRATLKPSFIQSITSSSQYLTSSDRAAWPDKQVNNETGNHSFLRR